MRRLTYLLPSLVLVVAACGGSEQDSALFGGGAGAAGAPSTQGGSGGASAGSGGASAGSGGASAGSGGASAGSGGAAAGSGGAAAGSGGAAAGKGGAGGTAGTSAGSGGASAGSGGGSAGKGGGAAGVGGIAGVGGATAGKGGAGGTAGASAGSGGASAGSAGVGGGGSGCTDGSKNGTETDVDCGGDTCKPCPDGKLCQKFSDCIGAICNAGVCSSTPTCSDGQQNGMESDVDCGGPTCGPTCLDGQKCKVGQDCVGGRCAAGACKTPLTFSLGAPSVVTTATPGEPWFADIGDVDGDGQPDVLVADSTGHRVTFLKNSGGTLTAAGSTPVCTSPFHVLLRRMNADPHPDFVVACNGGNARVYYGDGAGNFSNPTTFTHPNVWANIVDELGGASGNDVVTLSNFSGQNSFIRFGNASGTFAPPLVGSLPQAPSHGIAVDVTNDGIKDVVVAGMQTDGNGTQIYVSRSNGNTTFTPLPNLAVAAGPRSLASADFDLDGNQDLVVASITADVVTVFLGNGDGTFRPGKAYAGGDGARWVVATDLDADGAPDLALVSINDDRLRIFLNDGKGGMVARPAITLGTAQEPRAIAAGDLDGDGLPDLVVPCSSDSASSQGRVLVFLNTSK